MAFCKLCFTLYIFINIFLLPGKTYNFTKIMDISKGQNDAVDLYIIKNKAEKTNQNKIRQTMNYKIEKNYIFQKNIKTNIKTTYKKRKPKIYEIKKKLFKIV